MVKRFQDISNFAVSSADLHHSPDSSSWRIYKLDKLVPMFSKLQFPNLLIYENISNFCIFTYITYIYYIYFNFLTQKRFLIIVNRQTFLVLGSKGWRSGESARLLASTNVARVQFPASTLYVGWVCCWLSPLLKEVFLRVLRCFPLLKKRYFQIPIRPGIR